MQSYFKDLQDITFNKMFRNCFFLRKLRPNLHIQTDSICAKVFNFACCIAFKHPNILSFSAYFYFINYMVEMSFGPLTPNFYHKLFENPTKIIFDYSMWQSGVFIIGRKWQKSNENQVSYSLAILKC